MSELTLSHQRGFPDHALLDFRFLSASPEGGVSPEVAQSPEGGVRVPLEPLRGDRELWLSEHLVQRDSIGRFAAGRGGNLLALSDARPIASGKLAEVTRAMYGEALRAAAAAGFPHLVRIWNYVPDINAGDGEDEAYKQFCVGRSAAMRDLAMDSASLPAASALGSDPGMPLQLTFLASRAPALHLENPRQTSARLYPARYGNEPPTFARASVYDRLLIISGTAAIIGHTSQFPGQVDRQLRCAIDNLLLLMDHACAEADARRVENLHARVYLRHAQDLPAVQAALQADLPNLASAVYLRADVCRRELLVEIEAAGTLR